MATLRAEFEQDRTQVGLIRLFRHSGGLVKFYSALGKAAVDDATDRGNPTCSPISLYGDTPLGRYKIIAISPSGPGTPYDSHRYGDVGVIKLDPIGGDALLAKSVGRTGLLVHGGDPGPHSLLRRTNGCIRMMNSELRDLLDQIDQLGENVDTLDVAEVGGAGLGACDDNGRCGEQDPPPL